MSSRSQALHMQGETLVKPRLCTDRELLDLLKMSDADAAAYLGRTRQALHSKLGPRNGSRAGPSGYLKTSDILTLVTAAREFGRDFKPNDVLDYVAYTRKASEPEAFELLESFLSEASPKIDVAGASAVILILPAFADMLTAFPESRAYLTEVVDEARDCGVKVMVIGPTSVRARLAGASLGVEDGLCFGHEQADVYSPTIIVVDERDPNVFILTHDARFVSVAPFNRATMTENALAMLPPEVRRSVTSR
jgi:hypothetical protein